MLPENLYKIKNRDGRSEVNTGKRNTLQEEVMDIWKKGSENFFLIYQHVLLLNCRGKGF